MDDKMPKAFDVKERDEMLSYFREVYESDYDRKIMYSDRVSVLCPEDCKNFGTYRLKDCIIGTDIKSILVVCDVILDGSVLDYVMKLESDHPWLETVHVSCLRCSDDVPRLDDRFVRVKWCKGWAARRYSLKLFDCVSDSFEPYEMLQPVEIRALDLFTEYNDVYGILYNFFKVTNDARFSKISYFARRYDERFGCARLVELCDKLDVLRIFDDLMSIEPGYVYAGDGERDTLDLVRDVCRMYYDVG
ncbi:MAG: hypothetical protein HDQ88_00945 [Clostridia bacterium]|nr:hypothetical protein [Clostridia bacterium]